MRATDILFRRVRKFQLTTKMVKHGFYKGNRTGKMGNHTKRGGFEVDYDLVRTYVPPAGWNVFEANGVVGAPALTPFVTRRLNVRPGSKAKGTDLPLGAGYLARWKTENGDD